MLRGIKIMKLSEIELPSNRRFGFFFTFVFALAAFYFFISADLILAQIFTAGSLIFSVISLVKSEALLPLNKLWMRFGLILGTIVSPIVLGMIFFGIFTPIAIIMRLSGRDELRLKFTGKSSYWVTRSVLIKPDSFRNQF